MEKFVVYEAINAKRKLYKMTEEQFKEELEHFKNIYGMLGDIELLRNDKNGIEFYDDEEDATYTLCKVTKENKNNIIDLMNDYYDYLERVKEVERNYLKGI